MNIQVTGHKGMLGKEVCAAVARYGHKLIAVDADIMDMPSVINSPDVLINCAGLVPQRIPKPSIAQMMLVNGYGPLQLAEWCETVGTRLIHVSTDCVFDGSPEGPHTEDKNTKPMSIYGRSKLAGEVTDPPHLTVRTSFVGLSHRGLVGELWRCIRDGKTYRASDRYWWTGHTARFVAEILVILAERGIEEIIHVPGEEMSRFHLVQGLKKAMNLMELKIHRMPTPMIDRRLISDRWELLGLPAPPPFDWQLEWLRRSYLSAS